MREHRIELQGRGLKGTVVNAHVLRAVLEVVIDGSQEALRIRTQGRSRARGTLPKWIEAASQFEVEVTDGSTVLNLTAPSLLEASPDEFSQGNLFPEVDANLSGFDYLKEAFEAAAHEKGDTQLYDRGMLSTMRRLEHVFDRGVDSIGFATRDGRWGRRFEVNPQMVRELSRLERRIPPPQQARIAGYLDSIRHSDHTFTIKVPGRSHAIKGVVPRGYLDALQTLWGKAVLITGRAHFTVSGNVQRIEAEKLEAASKKDLRTWNLIEPVRRPAASVSLRVEQGPRSGMAAILGRWPGDEPDEEIGPELARMS